MDIKLGVLASRHSPLTSPPEIKNGKKNIAVLIDIENISDKSQSFNSYYYKLNNQDGTNYDKAITDIDSQLSSGTIQPTKKAKGYLVFDVPSDVTTNQLEFVYEPISFDSSQIIWSLN